MNEKKIIGIIEDNVQTAISISQTLDFNGFQTFQAYNENSLRKELENKKPDLIIISANMTQEPICKIINNLKSKVIVISHSNPEISCNIKNIRGAISKPIEPETLLKKVRKELDPK